MKNVFSAIAKPIGFILLVVGILWALQSLYASMEAAGYHYDPMTQTTTWTDANGNTFIKGPDGSVRQVISNGN